MRLNNDRPKDGPEDVQIPDFFLILSSSLLCSFGILTFAFAPMAMLSAHARLPEPWPKLVAVAGAALAVLAFEQPAPWVVLSFIFGLVSSDSLNQGYSIFWGFLRAILAAVIATLGALVALSRMENMGPWAFWVKQVGDVVDLAKTQWGQANLSGVMDWDAWQRLLVYEGPFQFVAFLMVCFWLAAGMGAHFGWFKGNHPWSGRALRAIPLLKSVSFLFLGLFMIVAFRVVPTSPGGFGNGLLSGLLGIGRAWMFIQGSLVLSKWLTFKKLSRQQKTLAYCLGVFPGFYALIGLGVLGPWFGFVRAVPREPLEEGSTEPVANSDEDAHGGK